MAERPESRSAGRLFAIPAREPSAATILLADGRRCAIRTFPAEPRLERDVLRAAETLLPRPRAEVEFLMALQGALRRWYPRLVIRPRDAFGSVGEIYPMWYVFRDGAVHRQDVRRDRLHRVLADAREVVAESERALARARSTADVVASLGRRPDGERGSTGAPGGE